MQPSHGKRTQRLLLSLDSTARPTPAPRRAQGPWSHPHCSPPSRPRGHGGREAKASEKSEHDPEEDSSSGCLNPGSGTRRVLEPLLTWAVTFGDLANPFPSFVGLVLKAK